MLFSLNMIYTHKSFHMINLNFSLLYVIIIYAFLRLDEYFFYITHIIFIIVKIIYKFVKLWTKLILFYKCFYVFLAREHFVAPQYLIYGNYSVICYIRHCIPCMYVSFVFYTFHISLIYTIPCDENNLNFVFMYSLTSMIFVCNVTRSVHLSWSVCVNLRHSDLINLRYLLRAVETSNLLLYYKKNTVILAFLMLYTHVSLCIFMYYILLYING